MIEQAHIWSNSLDFFIYSSPLFLVVVWIFFVNTIISAAEFFLRTKTSLKDSNFTDKGAVKR
jgi:hypothetical protein